MDTRDIKGALASLKHYALSILEYDKVTTHCKLLEDKYELQINLDDKFQSKASWNDKVGQELLEESFDYETPLEAATADMFERLEKLMKLPERELRFGLNLIGQSIEAGSNYRTHVGLEFVASMKKEQEKTMLMLPNRNPAPVPVQPPAPPVQPPASEEVDEIPF